MNHTWAILSYHLMLTAARLKKGTAQWFRLANSARIFFQFELVRLYIYMFTKCNNTQHSWHFYFGWINYIGIEAALNQRLKQFLLQWVEFSGSIPVLILDLIGLLTGFNTFLLLLGTDISPESFVSSFTTQLLFFRRRILSYSLSACSIWEYTS